MSEERNNQQAPEMELSEILQVRRDKLAALQQEGRDPFQQTKFARTAWSQEINIMATNASRFKMSQERLPL